MNLLNVENVSKTYSEKVLLNKNVSFGINDGDKIGLIGLNGSGNIYFIENSYWKR